MLKTQPSQRSGGPVELIVVWASSDGTRCVLAIFGGVLELRLENNGTLLRHAHYIDIRPACEAAQQWRIDWDIESRSRRQVNGRILCPECGDEAFKERDAHSGAQWFRCASCGDARTLDEPRNIQGR